MKTAERQISQDSTRDRTKADSGRIQEHYPLNPDTSVNEQ